MATQNHDRKYKGVDQLHEDYLDPRVVYKREQDRGGDNVRRKSSASHYAEKMGSSEETDHKCWDCGSRRCNRGSECSRLHQDVYVDDCSSLDDIRLNEFQSNVGRYESIRRYESGGFNWISTIDKGREEHRQCSFDLNRTNDSKITTPLKIKKTGLCQKFLQGQCQSGASCRYVHDVAGHCHHGHMPYMLADHAGQLSTDNSPAKDWYSYSADILHSHSSKHRYKRCIRRYADADGCFKKRRTEATWRHEASYHFEDDGRISRNSISCGGHLQCVSNEQSWEVRRGNETVTENSSICKTSDESLHSTESKGVIGWQRRQIGCGEASNGNESSDTRSESSDVNVNINSCTRSRKMNKNNEKQLTGKYSRKESFHRWPSLRNRNNRAIKKNYGFRRKTHYYPDHKHLHDEDAVSVLCKYYLRGYCRRGNRCWFLHETDSSKAPLGLNEEKRSITKHKSVATNEIPHGQDLSSNNSNRLLQKDDRSSGLIDESMSVKSTAELNDTTTSRAETFSGTKFMPESYKHTQPAIGKKRSETSFGKKISLRRAMRQECVDNGDQVSKGDDGCANYLVEGTDDKDSSVDQAVEGKELFADPSLLIRQNSVSEIPSVVPDSFVEVGKSEDQAEPLSSSHKQNSCIVSKSGATHASKQPCPPCSCLEDVGGILDINGVNLNSQFLSSGPEVNASQKAIISNGFDECSSVQRIIAETSVGKPLEHQPGLQEGFALMGEQVNCVNGDQSVSSSMSKNPTLSPIVTGSVTGCYEKVTGMEIFQETLVHDVVVGDDNLCGSQKRKGNNEQINNRLFTASCGASHSTREATDQVGEEMLVCGMIPFPLDANSAAIPATEEAIFNDIGLDMSLDHYIYNNLSLEHYISHMEDGNKATAHCTYKESHMEDGNKATAHCTYKEQRSLLEDSTVAITSANLIQGSNVQSPLPSDRISETKHICASTGLSPTRIISKEGEETAWKPNFEQHDKIKTKEQEERPVVKLEPFGSRNTYTEETFLRVNNEPSSSQNEGIVTTIPRSSDKHIGSLSVAEPVKTVSSNISKELGAIMSGCHSEQYEGLASKQNQQMLNPKEPAAVCEANEKYIVEVDSHEEAQKFSCDGSHNVGCKCKEGNNDGDDKLLLRLAVLQLAKMILNPLWKAGRIKSKEIYKSITSKVVDKVCVSVQGVNIPRTKESVDHYLLHHKPKIAQLVLAYVNMYPVSL